MNGAFSIDASRLRAKPGVTDYSAHHFNAAQRSGSGCGGRRCTVGRGREDFVGAPTTLRCRGGISWFQFTAFWPYPWRPVLALDLVRAIPTALYSGIAPPQQPLGLQSRDGLLGTAQALCCTLGSYSLAAGTSDSGQVWRTRTGRPCSEDSR